MPTIILTLLLMIFSLPIMTAHAGEIEQCGTPQKSVLSTDTAGFCDIYTRQLSYRIEANEMRNLILLRQKNFQAPAVAARKQYEKNIAKLNEERGE